MRRNLDTMIGQAKKAGTKVLLVGMRMPPNYGPEYEREFADAFGALAKRHRTAYVPFLLEGMADDLAKFQPDRIHPTAQVQPILLENVWQALRPLLR
jgi:acyl-CoA thioesterase-1